MNQVLKYLVLNYSSIIYRSRVNSMNCYFHEKLKYTKLELRQLIFELLTKGFQVI